MRPHLCVCSLQYLLAQALAGRCAEVTTARPLSEQGESLVFNFSAFPCPPSINGLRSRKTNAIMTDGISKWEEGMICGQSTLRQSNPVLLARCSATVLPLCPPRINLRFIRFPRILSTQSTMLPSTRFFSKQKLTRNNPRHHHHRRQQQG